MGRNSRPPKKANHGARPCSNVMKKFKKRAWWGKRKEKITPEYEPNRKMLWVWKKSNKNSNSDYWYWYWFVIFKYKLY